MSHLAPATVLHAPVSLDRPASNFDLIEEKFQNSHPIHKLFSISRRHRGRTLLIEQVPPTGNVAEENEDLAAMDPGFEHQELLRLSFWKRAFTGTVPADLRESECIGYALLKKDKLTRRDKQGLEGIREEWHVYEAVFRIYPHRHTFTKASARFTFTAAGRQFRITGCLYAEQNGVNKTCAQVSIRSIATSYLGHNRISYRQINALAADGNGRFDPSGGLDSTHIGNVLSGLKINHHAVEYEEGNVAKDTLAPSERYPVEKLLYAGIEGGCGALMSFKPNLKDDDAPQDELHMIPFFGHTFNEDSWVPNAQKTYFRIGPTITYIPSLSWLSHFIVHDDNFGANLCIPRTFIQRDDVRFVYELLPKGWTYSGVDAETTAAYLFSSILTQLPDEAKNKWLDRLNRYSKDRHRVILRHVPITTEQYLKKLKLCSDWAGLHEAGELIDICKEMLPRRRKLWMIEISVPEVFPTNKRKLGEILLDASRPLELKNDNNFILGRLPGNFMFLSSHAPSGNPIFTFVRSRIQSHTELF